jgi:hypothetical protein
MISGQSKEKIKRTSEEVKKRAAEEIVRKQFQSDAASKLTYGATHFSTSGSDSKCL